MVTVIRDRQRSRVYDWEETHVAPHDYSPLPFENIQMVVDYVWKQEGLRHPPRVELLPKANKNGGDATRTTVRFHETAHTWIVLHELAHAMSSTATSDVYLCGQSNAHGAIFLGIYIQLLSRYLNLPFGDLVRSAEAAGLRVKLDARPVFL